MVKVETHIIGTKRPLRRLQDPVCSMKTDTSKERSELCMPSLRNDCHFFARQLHVSSDDNQPTKRDVNQRHFDGRSRNL